MSIKWMCCLALALAAPACVTDGDDEPVPSDPGEYDPPPQDDYPSPTCGELDGDTHRLKGDGSCLPE
jgi:hypothetical protein